MSSLMLCTLFFVFIADCRSLVEDDKLLSFSVTVKNVEKNIEPSSQLFKFSINDNLEDKVRQFCAEYDADDISCLSVLDAANEYTATLKEKSRKRNIALIIGTRPDVIKLSLFISSFKKWKDNLNVYVINTGQHKEMLQPLLAHFNISVHKDLALMTHSDGGLTSFFAAALQALNDCFRSFPSPLDMVVVQGDTSTALAGAMTAFFHRIPVTHVEAGLRSGDLTAPFPEEGNRKIIDSLSSLHLAPTERARQALLTEGISPDAIRVVGNTVIDALDWTLKKNLTSSELAFLENLPVDLAGPRHVLVSAHRRENWGPGIDAITAAVGALASKYPQRPFLFLLHLNPAVGGPVRKALAERRNVHLLEPVPYAPFARLLATAAATVTDSGGMQEEAAFLGTSAALTAVALVSCMITMWDQMMD